MGTKIKPMKISTLISGALLLSSYLSFAGPGDSTVVRAMDHMDLTWYGSYSDTATLPSQATTYNKILMVYTMGCASGGCSDWDYTTQINLYEPTGMMDSSVASLDTISTNPLVIDTTWNVFEVNRTWELGRVITPYGGYMRQGSAGYNNSWEHPFVFDVTDFAHLLHDTVAIAAAYKGWSSGFSATVDFIFIEGTPARPVVQMNQVYSRYGQYIQTATFESNVLPPVTVPVNPNAVDGVFRFTPTGHGFVNALNCAEFCNKHFTLYKDGAQVARHDMWRDDCGMNPIYPQGGTWLYDRANWCPGDDAIIFQDEIGSLSGLSQVEMNVDVEAYSYTVPSGETPAGYELEGVLVQYDDFQIDVDGEITDIIAPNNNVEFRRYNPACRQAMVRITNRGGDTLTSAVIRYGIPGSWIQHYTWSGSLAYGESEVVTMPMVGPWPWANAQSGEFEAHIDVAGDQVAYNNDKFSQFDIPTVHPSNMVIVTRTNAAGNETHWELFNDAGQIVASRDGLSSNQFFYDTLDLPSGCYELRVMDRGKDGLSWWANNDGAGYVQLRNNGGTTPLFLKLQADFGTEIRHMFTIDGELSVSEHNLDEFLDVAPNPSNGIFEMLYSGDAAPQAWVVTDLQGRVIAQSHGEIDVRTMIDLSSEAVGMYVLRYTTDHGTITKKLVINR
ncbi:MAG: T9SS type A sorting domain-containing protein [Bacteroidetes bacterium]|nr:MAG: T9SS type A sorting domain-containing protein [Bacteroidota bacterium]